LKNRLSDLPVGFNRKVPPSYLVPFSDCFLGFEKVEAVRRVFGNKTESVLSKLKLAFLSYKQMYMGIRDNDGNIAVGTYHLKHGDITTVYLDVVHELFHVGQFMKDRKYFRNEHMKFMRDRALYYASPIEVPAYFHTVREAERLGLSRKQIVEYLKMGPAPVEIFKEFLKQMKLKSNGRPSLKKTIRPPVRVRRNISIPLYPFKDYFKGFEKIDCVRLLYGRSTERVLGSLRIEFADSPFDMIFPNDEGHLIVSQEHLKNSDPESLYLDVILCLNVLGRASQNGSTNLSEMDGFANSPVIIESYKSMLDEARRLGISKSKVSERLQFPRFLMSEGDYEKFARKLQIS
jgi:hypothetical protein